MISGCLPDYVRTMPRVFLREGELILTSRPLVVQTVLGSCVSVTMRDPRSGLSAICHAAMPSAPQWDSRSLRYVDCALDRIIRRFHTAGVPSERLQVKVVGGADLREGADQPQFEAVGTRNLQVALERLRSEGLAVTASHAGGASGRGVFFVTSTGEILVHVLPHSFGSRH